MLHGVLIADRAPVCYGDAVALDLVALLARPGWHADALCREYPTLPWIPDRGQSLREMRAVCHRCSIRAECLVAGIDGDEHGIWGGTSGRERRLLRDAA